MFGPTSLPLMGRMKGGHIDKTRRRLKPVDDGNRVTWKEGDDECTTVAQEGRPWAPLRVGGPRSGDVKVFRTL